MGVVVYVVTIFYNVLFGSGKLVPVFCKMPRVNVSFFNSKLFLATYFKIVDFNLCVVFLKTMLRKIR